MENKLFFNHQYGFRSGHSTELAALELTYRIITALDNHNTPLNIFLDLSKAFDTLDHTILLDKLLYYGIRGTAYNLLKEYSSLQENPYNVRYIHNVLIIHIYFAPQAVDNV